MKKLSNKWKKLKSLILSINSSEIHFNEESKKIVLNCNFDNLAKGRCEVHLFAEKQKKKNELFVFSDKALMEVRVYFNQKNFEDIIKFLYIKSSRKKQLSIFPSEGLLINNNGYLYVRENTKVEILDQKWLFPLS